MVSTYFITRHNTSSVSRRFTFSLLLFIVSVTLSASLFAQEKYSELPTNAQILQLQNNEQKTPFLFNKTPRNHSASFANTFDDTSWNINDWGPTVLLADSNDSYPIDAAIKGDTIHVAYVARNSSQRLMYVRSTNGISYQIRDLTNLQPIPRKIAYTQIAATEKCVLIFFLNYINGRGISPLQLIRSFDNGATFDSARVITTQAFAGIEIHPAVEIWKDTILLIARGAKNKYAYLIKSTDNGTTWITVKTKPPRIGDIASDKKRDIALTSSTIHLVSPIYTAKKYRAGETVYFRSTNMGKSWKKKTALSMLDGYTSDYPRIVSTYSGHLHTVWRDGRLGSASGFSGSISYRRSTDTAKTWMPEAVLTQQPNSLMCTEEGNALAVEKNEGNVLAVGWQFETASAPHTLPCKVRVSIDGGSSWYPEHILNPYAWAGNPSMAVSKNRVVAVWIAIEKNSLSFPYVRSALLPKRKQSANSQREGFVPEEIQLQNYPNPFNPSTAISFQLSAVSNVSLKIYNVLGEEIATLLNNEKKEAGKYEVEFSAANIVSGVYYAHLSVENLWGDNYREVKKLLLVK
jgi:hypothetical protein